IASQIVRVGIAGIVESYRRTRRDLRSELIHAFGPNALAAACIAGGKIIYTPPEAPTPRAARWLRAIAGHRDIQIVFPTDTMRRFFVERGVPIERSHLIRPGVEF